MLRICLNRTMVQYFRTIFQLSAPFAGNHDRKYILLLAVLKCLRWEIAAAMVPGLFLVVLNIARPFMISEAVSFLETFDNASTNVGYGLIGAFALVYIGTAL
jgi:ATP-binding cassette subfamily C (CFTR/MRP) protein 1